MVRILASLSLAIAPLVLNGCDGLPVFSAAKPTATTAPERYGSLRGFVYGMESRHQIIRGARVQAGLVSTLTGSPADLSHLGLDEDGVLERDGVVTVWHDFDDGRGLVPAERRLHAGSERFYYLRDGEFLLEGLPDGPVSVTASQCDTTSAALEASVTAGHTTDGLALALPISIPVMNGDSSIPRVVTWKSSTPQDGFIVAVAPEGDRLAYTPSPPNLTVVLQTPPYSGGMVIAGFEITYTWQTRDGQPASLKSQRVPVPPVMVPSASQSCPGAPVRLQVPLGTAELVDAFIRQGAGQVVARVRFIDNRGFEVQGPGLEALEVGANLRKL